MLPVTPLKIIRPPLQRLLRMLPDALHSEVFARLFNHLLKGQYMAEQLGDLEGKRLCLSITDSRSELLFVIRGQRFVRLPKGNSSAIWDVRIAGHVDDFWLLLTRSEDPDTLFFHRRLVLEGETETGLYIKNMLDALDFDWDAHFEAVLGSRLGALAGRILRRLKLEQRFGGNPPPHPE